MIFGEGFRVVCFEYFNFGYSNFVGLMLLRWYLDCDNLEIFGWYCLFKGWGNCLSEMIRWF